MTKGYVVFTTYVVDVDTSLPFEEGAHSHSGQASLLSSASSSSAVCGRAAVRKYHTEYHQSARHRSGKKKHKKKVTLINQN
jgi:hypothetical protein